jgi:hypothetical protein
MRRGRLSLSLCVTVLVLGSVSDHPVAEDAGYWMHHPMSEASAGRSSIEYPASNIF